MSVLIIMSDHSEAKFLLRSMPGVDVVVAGGYPFQIRERSGQQVVVGVSGIGVTTAALCTAAGINRFNPSAIIVAGTAGGIADGVKVGMVAVPSEVRFAPISARGDCLTIASAEPLTAELRTCYRQLHQEYIEPVQAPPEIDGPCMTVCTEVTEEAEANTLRLNGISIVEMEGYGVYLAAEQAGIPCAMIRYVSDVPGTDETNEVAAGLGAAAVDATLLRFVENRIAVA